MYDLPFSAPLFDTATVDRVLAQAERPIAALAEIGRTLKAAGRVIVVEDFDRLSERSSGTARNPIATLRNWFAEAGLECDRVHPIDTERGLLVVAVARRASLATVAA
jgi:ubiquinone/menaquinone biosynthesis C-methylase UbiE